MTSVLDDYRGADIDAKFAELLVLVEKAARNASGVTAADVDAVRAAGWSDEAIYDALTVCALFNFYTTWVDGSGVPDLDDYPSAVGWFRSHGHDAIAVHPYRVGMYKRQQVYERFGFQSFIHDTTIREHKLIDDNPSLRPYQVAQHAHLEELLRLKIAERTGGDVDRDLYPWLVAAAAVTAVTAVHEQHHQRAAQHQ